MGGEIIYKYATGYLLELYKTQYPTTCRCIMQSCDTERTINIKILTMIFEKIKELYGDKLPTIEQCEIGAQKARAEYGRK